MAFVGINLLTMLIPIACLWISRNLLGLDDPLSDNISANVVGLLLANAARFFLFRQFVFPHPDRRRPGRGRVSRPSACRPGPAGRSRSGPARPTSSRSSGRLTPTTLWWSPSIPVTNAPPRPSTVNAPATCSGSPVATYAAISASVRSAKWTVVEPVAAAT